MVLKNFSVIEYAEQAISFDKPGWQWIIASDCTFRNNKVTLNNIQSTAGPAKFTQCHFIIDDEYLESSYFPQVVSIHSTATLFRGCNFDFEPELASSISRQAITSYDGHILVTERGTTRSRFENWSKGINAAQNMDTRLVLVRGSDFTGNKYGIFSQQFWKTFAYDNQFNISNADISEVCWGIYTSESRSIQFHDNEFKSENALVYSTGIHVDQTASENLVIGESDFIDLDIGVDVDRGGTQANGLMLLCNQNIRNRDFDFKTANGIGPRQGSIIKPAGNTFSHTGVESASDFSALGINYNVNYFHTPGEGLEIPIYKTSNVLPFPSENSMGCEHFALFQDPFEGEDLGDYISHHSDIIAEILDKQDELNQPNLTEQQIREFSADLDLLELDRDLNISNAINYVLVQDSIIYNDLRTAINLGDDFHSEVSIAQTWIDQGEYATGITALETISNRMTLSQSESQDLDEILELTTMLLNVYNDNRIESMLTSEEIDTVEWFAYEGTGIGRNQARSLLTYFYGYDFSEEGPGNIQTEMPGSIRLMETEELQVWPNPSNDLIQLKLPLTLITGVITVYNLEGKVILTQSVDSRSDNTISIKTDTYPPGIYSIILEEGVDKLYSTIFAK